MINVACACDICEYAPIEKLFARYLSPGAASSLCICLLRKVNALTEISHSKAPISNKALWGHRWAEKKQSYQIGLSPLLTNLRLMPKQI